MIVIFVAQLLLKYINMNSRKHSIVFSFALLIMVCFGSLNANAQKVEIGFRFMPTFTSLKVNTSAGGYVSGEAKLGYGFGSFIGINFTDHIGVQAEIIYSSLAQKYTENNVEREIKLSYVNIPLLLSLNTGKSNIVNFNVVAGPQLGLNVGSKITTVSGDQSTITSTAVLAVKKSDVGFAYGAGIDFGLIPSGSFRIGLGYRGVSRLVDIGDNSKQLSTDDYYVLKRTKIQTNAFYVGFSFLF